MLAYWVTGSEMVHPQHCCIPLAKTITVPVYIHSRGGKMDTIILVGGSAKSHGREHEYRDKRRTEPIIALYHQPTPE